ncbi:MAG: class D beta-lactamase [Gammaproteobacteria bacterium]|nr:class D beta-lactamase [Gammaproteobacteria bacterium]
MFNFAISSLAFAETNCFIAKENGHIIKQEGECAVRHSPCSTFKIAISLMGYNEGILLDATHPEFLYKPGYIDSFGPFPMEAWKQPQNPTTWIKNSCIWYSQLITQKMGVKKFKQYVRQFQYGNQDVAGDPKKNNGLTHAWLSSSLQISPQEQVTFIEKLVALQLPVRQKATTLTRDIFFIETLSNGWRLYGKTGTGFQLNPDGSQNQDRQIGWFVGWVEKQNRKIIFAQYAEDKQKMDSTAGRRVKEIAKERIIHGLINKGSLDKPGSNTSPTP